MKESCLVPSYARTGHYRTGKASSSDLTGANIDFIQLAPSEKRDLFSLDGPGVITHIWLTIGYGDDPNFLKNMVLRAYWDFNEKPSIEVPVGDFFGLNLNKYVNYQSRYLNCAPSGALNSYFAMPFQQHARLELTNEGPKVGLTVGLPGPTLPARSNIYWNIDYRFGCPLPDDCLYFHAQYRQKVPNEIVNISSNKDGQFNYVFADTRGSGQLVGVTLGVQQDHPGWFGEGDDMTFIEDESTPAIMGTGTEDYFNGAWDFGQPFSYLYHGAPSISLPQLVGGECLMYRWHTDNPITFETYMKHTIEHGTQNSRADNYYSVCYWYQSTPYTDFPPLPAPKDRIPPVLRTVDIRDGRSKVKGVTKATRK